MAKKITLDDLARMLTKQGKELDLIESVGIVVKNMATKDDIAELRSELKGDVLRVGEQVTSIETQLLGMQHTKLHARVADLEEEVFGKTRG